MAVLKNKTKRDNFLVVSKIFLQDKNLSLTERGLLATMHSLPDDWDFTIAGMGKILPDGESKIRSALDGLVGKFHAIGHSEAVYQAKQYGIYASDLKYITPEDNQNIVIRVMTTPDMKDDKPMIASTIAVMKNGIVVREVSSKGMDEKKFNQAIYEIQEEYGIKKCSVVKNKAPRNARQI